MMNRSSDSASEDGNVQIADPGGILTKKDIKSIKRQILANQRERDEFEALMAKFVWSVICLFRY